MYAAIAFSDVCSLFVVILALRVAWMSHQACCINPALEAEARPPLGCSPLEVRVWVRGLNPSPRVTNSVLPVQNREWEEMVAEGKMVQALRVTVGEHLCVRGVIGKAEMWSGLKILCRYCCPGLTEPRRMTYPFFIFWISVILHIIPAFLSSCICQKQRPTFFRYSSTLFSVTLVTGCRPSPLHPEISFKCWILMFGTVRNGKSLEKVIGQVIKILVTLSQLAAKHKERKLKGIGEGEHKQQRCKC